MSHITDLFINILKRLSASLLWFVVHLKVAGSLIIAIKSVKYERYSVLRKLDRPHI